MQVSIHVTVESPEELATISQVLGELSQRLAAGRALSGSRDGAPVPVAEVTHEEIEALRSQLTDNARRALKRMAEMARGGDGFVVQDELAKDLGGVTPNTLSGWLQSLYFASRRRNLPRDRFYTQGRRQGRYGYRMSRDMAQQLAEAL